MAYKSQQQGFSFFGMLFIAAIVAVLGVIAMQVMPTVIEYNAVNKAAARAATATSINEARSLFDKAVGVDDIKSITGKDIEVSKDGDKTIVNFAYQREIHLVGPAYLTLKYSGGSK